MIEYIRGELVSLTPTTAIIETGGIGYETGISLTTYAALENLRNAKLLIHEVIREDAHVLFGFASERERALFRLLIGVSGVGAGTARIILSAIPPEELEVVITSGDVRRLKSAKGVGAKTAERIIVDLKDKIKPSDDLLLQVGTQSSDVFDEALAALVMLGFQKAQSQKVLNKIFSENAGVKVEVAIKKALAMM